LLRLPFDGGMVRRLRVQNSCVGCLYGGFFAIWTGVEA
jgi:hypothetical protein